MPSLLFQLSLSSLHGRATAMPAGIGTTKNDLLTGHRDGGGTKDYPRSLIIPNLPSSILYLRPMAETDTIDETTILSLLRRRFPLVRGIAERARLKQTERTLVLRCALDADGSDAPSTVIVKRMLASEECGFSDWSSLEFIGTTPGSDLVPGFYTGDSSKGIYIIEDLGGSESIDDLLRRDDRAAATDALMRLAEECAKLHRATLEGEREFKAIRWRLPGANGLGRHREGERWDGALERVRGWFASTGVRLDERFDAECAWLNARYVEPGAFLAFTHGDIAPSNNHVRDGEVKLLDFEYGGYRHALYDMAVWNVLCPLPASLLEPMLARYRESLGTAFPTGGEEFAREWDAICAWRGIGMLGWFTPRIMEGNRPWVEEWSSRDAFLRSVRTTAERASHMEETAGIAGSFARLAAALAALWSDTEGSIPRWRALGGNAKF
jgi:hypothetical protein